MTARAVAAVALVLACSCAAPSSGALRVATPVNEGERWRDVVQDSTRRCVDYDWLLRTADMRATLLTPRLRAAFARSRDEFQGRFAGDMAMELVALGRKPDEGVDAPMQTGPSAEEEVLVFVAMYVTDRKNRDLSASYTIWDKELVRGDAREKPTLIETVRASPAVVEMFPFVDSFDDLYLMHFPLVDKETGASFLHPGDEPLQLVVESALANCVVSWDLVE